MGLFDIFKKKHKKSPILQIQSKPSSIPDTEKKYYQPDSYYTSVVNKGSPFEQRVITFEERKKTAIPSDHGLYPAEILLLEYCRKGDYPAPKYGYPGFWWFSYGIRDVGSILKSLENKGFIRLGAIQDSIRGFTVVQLKELLTTVNQPTSGKKADLIKRVSETISEEVLLAAGLQRKYVLTELGELELTENAYVPYMHKSRYKTIENTPNPFNVWSINNLLGTGSKTNWRVLVEAQEQRFNADLVEQQKEFMHNLKRADPESYEILRSQDKQIATVQKAQNQYNRDKNIDKYIEFWENLWKNGGLIFESSGWLFELADLYIKEKRYNDALSFVKKIKQERPTYANKANVYISRILALKEMPISHRK